MDLALLEKKLPYSFRNKAILEEACRHSSFVNELPKERLRDNERLEFLGDAVLSLVISHMLMREYPDLSEGDLSRMRAGLVNENQLAEVAKKLKIGDFLSLGKGEMQTGGRNKKSILADALEAIIAAIYLDGGFKAAFLFVEKRFAKLLAPLAQGEKGIDFKSKLQEMVQVTHKKMPRYKVTGEIGPDHNKTFIVKIEVAGFTAEGKGKTKKMAEQDAAKKILALFENTGSGT